MNPNDMKKAEPVFPPVIYGTSYLGNLYREMPETDKLALMREWFRVEQGQVMIDSAGKYGAGLALEVIGKGLERLGIDPEQITISNKLGWYRVPLSGIEPTFEPGAWANLNYDAVQRISYRGILECWEQGCELLGAKYRPALVSVHDPDEYLAAAEDEKDRERRLQDILDAYRALFELKEKGEVRAVGIGSKDARIIRELCALVAFDWVMIANQFTLYRHPVSILELISRLHDEGVHIINSGIFNAGFLTGGAYFDYRLMNPDKPGDRSLYAWRENFFAVCEQYGVTPGDACLKFALSAPQISSVALNPGKPFRMAHNRKLIEEQLNPDFWKEMKRKEIIDSRYPYF
ncbi:MAG: aldo/keto reductase [Mangrovibacterium sp.]